MSVMYLISVASFLLFVLGVDALDYELNLGVQGCGEYVSFRRDTRVTWILDDGRIEMKKPKNCISYQTAPVNMLRVKCTDSDMTTLHERTINGMPNLRYIIFKNNAIKIVRNEAFFNLTRLQVVDLSYNRLEVIEERAFHDLPLTVLKLHNNFISMIESSAFANLPKLKNLFLRENKLRSWDDRWFENAEGLKTIVASKNNIQYIPGDAFAKEKFPILLQVDLSDNAIRKLSRNAFRRAESLKTLNLGYNRIVEFPADLFRDCNNLQTLMVHGNNLSYIHEGFFENYSKPLKRMTTQGNPWQCACRQEIATWTVKRGMDLDYMNYGCANEENPLCALLQNNFYRNGCVRFVFEELFDRYYKKFDYSHNDSICIKNSLPLTPTIIKLLESDEYY